MKILDRLIIALFSLIILALSVFLIMIPFNVSGFLSIQNISYFIVSMNRNYYYTLAGILLFIASIRIIFSGFSRKGDEVRGGSYLITRNDFGEIMIYSNTIVSLVQTAVEKFSGISNIKIDVRLMEGQVGINLTGDVLPGVSIPEVTKELQSVVKEYIENATGAQVSEINVKTNNVSVPTRVVR
jgi:uncharacterized alkaline shock family protein YloU